MVWVRKLALVFGFIFVLVQAGLSASQIGQTDAQGYFEIMVAPGKAITGTLLDCLTGLPVSNAQVTVAYTGTLNRGTPVRVSVPGYETGIFPVRYLASSWHPSGSYTTYGLGKVCLSSKASGTSVTCVIGEDGQFTARFDGLTVAGHLSECGAGPLSGKRVTVVRIPGEGERDIFRLSVPGYQEITVHEYSSLRFLGVWQVSLGSLCMEPEAEGAEVPPGVECPCTQEIGQLSTGLSQLSTYIRDEIAPSLSEIDETLSRMCPPSVENYCPGPFPGRGGEKFLQFVSLTQRLISLAAQDLPAIQEDDPQLQGLLEAAGATLYAVLPEMDQLRSITDRLGVSYRNCLDTYVPDQTIVYLEATVTLAEDQKIPPKLKVLLESKGLDVARNIFDKVKIWVDLIPVVGKIFVKFIDDIQHLIDSAVDALTLAGLLLQNELEKKLDAIVKGLFGVNIPHNATEKELQELLGRIPSTSVPEQLAGLKEATRRMEEEELPRLEKKICCLSYQFARFAEELGEALYGRKDAFSSRIILPSLCQEETFGGLQCFGPMTATPPLKTPEAIKPEIKNLEESVETLKRSVQALEELVKEILERLRGQPGTQPLPPYEEPPCCALTKKIYVYDEGTFAPTASGEQREILVITPAFDLSGWLDLSELRKGDVVRVQIWVRVAGKERLFNSRDFRGGADSRLIHFCELTDNPRGCPQLVGSWIKIVISQPQSADNFTTPIEIGYQFIVESQR